MTIPSYWKNELKDIDGAYAAVTRGAKRVLCKSAGGRDIYLIEYGERTLSPRDANYSSAAGAGMPERYQNKSVPGYRPCVLLIGGIHGAEFEGTTALLNLISLLETGADLAGAAHPALLEAAGRVQLVIIPSANPDGRARVPFPTMAGQSFEALRYYNQGTWKDGSLCGYPECKAVHPIKEAAGFLGGYFNNDGVNLMHDSFFAPMAEETKALIAVTDQYAPDFSIQLHGGANCRNVILKPAYAHPSVRRRVHEFEERLQKACESRRLAYRVSPLEQPDGLPAVSFNLASALTHVCGEPCVVYETNQGLAYGDEIYTHDDIYRQHLVLFEEIFNDCAERNALQGKKAL